MNCSQAQKISIREILESFSLFPSKENSKTAFYFALDREEKTPSLSVDFIKNTAFDFGTGKKYDCVSIVQAVKKCSISDALKYLEKFDFSNQNQIENSKNSNEKNYKIVKILDELSHPALLKYLDERKVADQTKFLKEIHFEMKNSAGEMKKYFAVGFKNNLGGYEFRNKFFKGCLGKKGLTLIKNNGSTLKIFEGFFDFLSFKGTTEISKNDDEDYLILNSLSMVRAALKYLENYKNAELFLDNDPAGTAATNLIIANFPTCEDRRNLYEKYKDVNTWICR